MKKLFSVIPLAVLLCFTFACQNRAEKAELEKFRAQAKVEQQNKELVKRGYEAWNKGDFEAHWEGYAPDYAYYFPSISTKPISRKDAIELSKTVHRAFPDINFSIEEQIAERDKVMSRLILRGTHQGEFYGIPATGNKIEVSAIVVTRVENGKIVEDREESDSLGWMQQLGMELKPKEDK